jgi:hypothetical protein
MICPRNAGGGAADKQKMQNMRALAHDAWNIATAEVQSMHMDVRNVIGDMTNNGSPTYYASATALSQILTSKRVGDWLARGAALDGREYGLDYSRLQQLRDQQLDRLTERARQKGVAQAIEVASKSYLRHKIDADKAFDDRKRAVLRKAVDSSDLTALAPRIGARMLAIKGFRLKGRDGELDPKSDMDLVHAVGPGQYFKLAALARQAVADEESFNRGAAWIAEHRPGGGSAQEWHAWREWDYFAGADAWERFEAALEPR